MEIEPYSIYINNRPFRIVFFVNPDQGINWVDKIFAYNREKWGGRLNPIILTNGKVIEEDWWKFLRGYDPDIICSTVPLEEELRKKIHIFLSPLRVEEIKPEYSSISIQNQPLSILPTGSNVSRVGIHHFDDKSSLVLFEIDDTTPDLIKSFLDRNFGLLEQGKMITYQLKKALETCQIKKYTVTDDVSLNEALLDLGDNRNSVVFPAQICALPNSLKESKHSYNNKDFEIIVGDSIGEVVHFWNRNLAMRAWLRTRFTQLWLPKHLASNETIRPGLGKFINRFVGSMGNDQGRGAHFVTFSLTNVEINAIGDLFKDMGWHPKRSGQLDQHSMPDYEHPGSSFFLQQGLDFHRAHSNEEHLVLNEPDVEQGVMGGEQWFVDLYIQYRPERFKNIIGKDYWWQLPRRNSLLRGLHFFNKHARINEHGMFSVLMNRTSSAHPDENKLVLKIPDDRAIFSALICGESYECCDRDEDARFRSRPFYQIQRSDKGKYLSGVLGLFPDLLNAQHFFEERFWRRIFERMANYNPEKDENVKSELLNKLRRKIKSGMDFKGSERAIEWLAHNVVNIAKKYSKEEVDLSYTILRDLAQQETNEYNKKPSGQIIEFDEKDFKDEISELVDLGVFLLGVKPKCPRCGYRIWYKIDDVKQVIICRGCGYEFSLPAESEWFYRLNSLIRVAVSLHGTIPLLITLGQLLFFVRSSAIFIPSIELLKKDSGNNEPAVSAEIDLVCIKDGQFVIGEVKQTIDLFDIHDFKKMSEIAKLIRPDLVIFSSMDKEPSAFVKDNIEKLRKDLEYLEVKVEWSPIHYWVFEPRPVG